MKFLFNDYIEGVTKGNIIAGQWTIKAVNRHLKDLETGGDRGIFFDESAAKTAIIFFSMLKHSKGEWAGRSFALEGWQQFVIGCLFGWKKENGLRRFFTSYLETARKNGKTTLAAGVGLYLLVADGEPGAEIYSAATKKEQAILSHSEAQRMAKTSPEIRREVEIFRHNIFIPNTASKFEPLGADSDTMDGLNVHGALIDEIHAHKTRGVWDVIETATGSRRQPLIFAITTAGFNRESLCWELHEYTTKVLDGIINDDSWFGMIFALDENDEWDDSSVWGKANPNLGKSKKISDMERLAERAKEIPSQLNAFLRLHLDKWTQAETRWIPWKHWQQCGGAVDSNGLRGRSCYGGLDLSSNTDITAWVLVFPPQKAGENYLVLVRFFIPEDSMIERVKRDRVPYDSWVRQGFIFATPGNVVDYDFIVHQIKEDSERFDIVQIAFDRWGATKIQTTLMDFGGDDWLVQFGQGYASMSPAMKELEVQILGHTLNHGNNPVLNWMASNLVVRQDPAGNQKPDKSKSIEKIDGMVALIMALDRATRHEEKKVSVYEERGLEVV